MKNKIMKSTIVSSMFLIILILDISTLPLANDAISQTKPTLYQEYSLTNILVKPNKGISDLEIEAVFSEMGIRSVEYFSRINVHKVEVLTSSVEAMVDQLNTLDIIDYAEFDYVVNTLQTPDDPDYGRLWGLHNTGQTGGTEDADIDAPEAWNITTGGDVLVSVIDTGVNYNHPDLAANMWVNSAEIPNNGVDDDNNGYIDDVRGWDFFNGDNNPMDDHNHGTHCSGTIGADGNNGTGVVGVNWSVNIMPVKFLSGSGGGYISGAIAAIDYSTTMGADISSNSWGGGGFSQSLYDAIEAFGVSGGLFIAAAGNSAKNNDIDPTYPASYDLPNIISVAATDHNDNKASFSCYGPTTVDVAAPGIGIFSTIINGYGTMGGTSMSAPYIAGIAVLVKSVNPNYGYTEIKQVILNSVDILPSLTGKILTDGRVNAYNALNDELVFPNIVKFSKPRFFGNEESNKATIKVDCVGECKDTIVDIVTSDSTAITPYDYSCAGTVVFSESSEEKLICSIIDDSDNEPTERFIVILDNPIRTELGEPWVAFVNIIDNDGNDSATLTINVPDADNKTQIKLIPKHKGEIVVWGDGHCAILQDEQMTGNIIIKPLDGNIDCLLTFE